MRIELTEEQAEFIRIHCQNILICCKKCEYPETKAQNERLSRKAKGILRALNKGVENA